MKKHFFWLVVMLVLFVIFSCEKEAIVKKKKYTELAPVEAFDFLYLVDPENITPALQGWTGYYSNSGYGNRLTDLNIQSWKV